MNLLTNDLPYAIEIDDIEYKIDTNYKNCIAIIIAWEDKDLTQYEKIEITLERLFGFIPPNPQIAIEKAMIFLNCGKSEEDTPKSKKINVRLYSFEKDSQHIFKAVDAQLNGFLSKEVKLHWYLFNASFMEISSESQFSKIIDLRNRKNKNKLTKEERQYWRENKEMLDLEPIEEVLTEEEKRNVKKFDEILRKKGR